MRSRIARIALTVVLLLATQFAVAGELCNSLMSDSEMGGKPGLGHEGMQPRADATEVALPCCDGVPMSTEACVAAVDGPSGFAFAPDRLIASAAAAPPARARISSAGHRPAPALRPVTLAGTPLPAYILLQRFLS